MLCLPLISQTLGNGKINISPIHCKTKVNVSYCPSAVKPGYMLAKKYHKTPSTYQITGLNVPLTFLLNQCSSLKVFSIPPPPR